METAYVKGFSCFLHFFTEYFDAINKFLLLHEIKAERVPMSLKTDVTSALIFRSNFIKE
jgi:hypothetical protein